VLLLDVFDNESFEYVLLLEGIRGWNRLSKADGEVESVRQSEGELAVCFEETSELVLEILNRRAFLPEGGDKEGRGGSVVPEPCEDTDELLGVVGELNEFLVFASGDDS
jgi:hypothetical protein